MITTFNRIRYWLAKPLLEAQSDLYLMSSLARYKEGYQAGFNLGHAIGQIQGHQLALDQLPETPTTQDIERIKQGLVH